MADLKKLEEEALAAIGAAKDDAAIEAVRVAALGKKGSISELLKTLGATRRSVMAIFAVEFALSGFVAGVIGTAGGAVMAWFVLTRGMEIAWTWRPSILAGAPVATVALSVLAGIAASAGALRRRPIEVLRAE